MNTQVVASLHKVRFSVTSDGTTGEAWIKRLKEKGCLVSDYAQDLLLSRDFKSTSGVTYKVTIIKGSFWKKDSNRTMENIHRKAEKLKLRMPNAEVACLIREKFTDEELKEMGLHWVVVMHEPIDFDGDLGCLSVHCALTQGFDADYRKPGGRWFRNSAFAFVSST